MRKDFIFICCLGIFLTTSFCSRFDKITEGMSTTELKEIVGNPDSIRNDFFTEVWFYDTHIVSVSNDTITMVRSKKEIREEMIEMQKEIERLNNK